MPVNYKIVNRADPGSRENGKHYPIPSVMTEHKVSFDEFLKIMSEKTRFHKVDLILFLYNQENILAELPNLEGFPNLEGL